MSVRCVKVDLLRAEGRDALSFELQRIGTHGSNDSGSHSQKSGCQHVPQGQREDKVGLNGKESSSSSSYL